ncbi:Ig-like domain-containing protein [bacterium]|nr:Ig-like domain-containing protein [bacterium]
MARFISMKQFFLFPILIVLGVACSSGGITLAPDAPQSTSGLASLTIPEGQVNLSGDVTVQISYDNSVLVTGAPTLSVNSGAMGSMTETSSGSGIFVATLTTSDLPNGGNSLSVFLASANLLRTLSFTVFNIQPSADLTIAAPMNGALVQGLATFQVSHPQSLNLTDLDYFVDNVQVDNDTTGSCDGLLDGPPYALPFCSWDSTAVTPGTHTVDVIGTFLENGVSKTTAATISIVVSSPSGNADIQSPSVSFLIPTAEGETISGIVPLKVVATDDHGIFSVSFLYRSPPGTGTPVTIGDASPTNNNAWSLSWPTLSLTDGQYELIAIATDTANNSSLASLTAVLDNSGGGGGVNLDPPCVEILNPAIQSNQTPVISSVVSLMAMASAPPSDTSSANPYDHCDGDEDDLVADVNIQRVEYFANGVLVGTSTDPNSNWQVLWTTTDFNNNTYELKALAYDSDGTVSSDGFCVGGFVPIKQNIPGGSFACVRVEVDNGTGDFTPPVIQIIDPLNGQQIAGQYTLIAQASDNVGVMKVEFFGDGVALPNCIDSNLNDGPDLDGDGNPDPGLATCYWDTDLEVCQSEQACFRNLTTVATDTSGNKGFSDVVQVQLLKALAPILETRGCNPAQGTTSCTAFEYSVIPGQTQPFSLEVFATATDQNSPPEALTYRWSMGDGAGIVGGQQGFYTYTTFDPAAPNFLVEVKAENQSGLFDTSLPDGSEFFFVIGTAAELLDLQAVTESETCVLDWPSLTVNFPAGFNCPVGNPRQSTQGGSVIVRNIIPALANLDPPDDTSTRAKVVFLQFFEKDSQVSLDDMNNHILPYVTGGAFPPNDVEIISIGLNNGLAGGTTSFIDLQDLADWSQQSGFTWTFVWDENNELFDQYSPILDLLNGGGWTGNFIPKYVLMDRNHHIRFSGDDGLDGLLQGQSFQGFIEGLVPCAGGNTNCLPTF